MTRSILIAGLFVAGAGVVALSQDKKADPQPDDKKAEPDEKPQTMQEMAEAHRPNHKRVNGALLTIKAQRAPRDRAGQVIEVEWAIDYNGPRLPFIIIAPSMELPTGVDLIAYYEDDKGHGRQSRFGPQALAGVLFFEKDRFVQAKGRNPVTGKLEIAISKIAEVVSTKGRKQPFRFGDKIIIQLHHSALDRGMGNGREFALDAWTGALSSDIVTIEL